MARIHLFEFEDLRWFPKSLRTFGTDFLQFLSLKTKMFVPVIPLLTEVLEKTQSNKIIDLGSGSGGPWQSLLPGLTSNIPDCRVTFTDFYPNADSLNKELKDLPEVNYHSTSVDARKVPPELKGVRTLFLSFHHFKEKEALQILQNAVNTQSGIAIFEGQERSIPSIIGMLFSPITVLLTTPFIKPFSIKRLLFTYIIPVIPIFVLWDGVVSSLRTYSIKEMKNLIQSTQNQDTFHWEVKKLKKGPSTLICTIGYPLKKI